MDAINARRRFLLQGAVVSLGVPAALALRPAVADDLKPLTLDNPTAKALAYVEKAEGVTHASYKPGSTCANCNFFTASTGACALFVGFKVAPLGWCAGWAAKA